MRAKVKDLAWQIERPNRERGGMERSSFIGSARNKPKGWRFVRYLGSAMGTPDGAGLC